ncbi:DUF2939 family protein [Sphingomonas sp. F9_3S_D5_B_2]
MRKVMAIVLVVVLAVGGWWYASPLWTLHELRAASEERNAAKVSRYVDYPALRQDLKGDLRRYITGQFAKSPVSEGGGKMGTAVALALLGPIVDSAVSPEGVAAMFARQKQLGARAGAKAGPVTASEDPIIERDGFDTFRVRDKDPAKGALVFRRSGLGWKLSAVDLPAPAGG